MSYNNLSQFTSEIRSEQKRLIANATEAIRSMALSLYTNLQMPALEAGGGYGSPVASGRYASSMRLSINQIDATYAPADRNYKYPPGHGPRPLPKRTIANAPVSSVSARLRTFRLGDTIYVSNSVPYVRRIEIGSHSWQTPGGVFTPTTEIFFRQFEAAFAKHGASASVGTR